jgi:hypothetical protein
MVVVWAVVVVVPWATIVDSATHVAVQPPLVGNEQDSYTVALMLGTYVVAANAYVASVIIRIGAYVPHVDAPVRVIVGVPALVGITVVVALVHCIAQVVVPEQSLTMDAPYAPPAVNCRGRNRLWLLSAGHSICAMIVDAVMSIK